MLDYVAVDDIHVNGKLTLGEDVADLGGLILAARGIGHGDGGQGASRERRADAVPALLRRLWTELVLDSPPETQRMRAITNPHSPEKYRANSVISNMPEFARAFSCKAGRSRW